jgi:hypothetical protein
MDPRGQASLVEEHLDELFLPRKMWVEALYRDEALKSPGAGHAREIHRGHPPGRELRYQLEPIELTRFVLDGDEPTQALASGTLVITPL